MRAVDQIVLWSVLRSFFSLINFTMGITRGPWRDSRHISGDQQQWQLITYERRRFFSQSEIRTMRSQEEVEETFYTILLIHEIHLWNSSIRRQMCVPLTPTNLNAVSSIFDFVSNPFEWTESGLTEHFPNARREPVWRFLSTFFCYFSRDVDDGRAQATCDGEEAENRGISEDS